MRAILLSALMLTFTLTSVAQSNEPLGDQLNDRFKSESFNLGILLQSVGVFSFDDDNFNGGRKFDLGATRVDIRGALDNNFSYRLQLDFRRTTSVMDAQIGYRFHPNHRVVAGAFKPFTSRDLDPNPGHTDFINRARHVGAMMNSREIGVTLLGDVDQLRYRVGIYNGTGLTRANDNRLMFTSRFEYALTEDVRLGINAALNQTRGVNVGNTGLTQMGDRVLYGIFAEYDAGDFFTVAEFLQTRFDAAQLGGDTETITGFYGTLGYRVNDQNEALVRYDYLGYDRFSNRNSSLVKFGWNHQATSMISFQVNLLAQFDDDSNFDGGLAGQMQFQF